jgi:hypothetical protein
MSMWALRVRCRCAESSVVEGREGRWRYVGMIIIGGSIAYYAFSARFQPVFSRRQHCDWSVASKRIDECVRGQIKLFSRHCIYNSSFINL